MEAVGLRKDQFENRSMSKQKAYSDISGSSDSTAMKLSTAIRFQLESSTTRRKHLIDFLKEQISSFGETGA